METNMTPELDGFLSVKRRQGKQRHITGRANTGRMVKEVARLTGHKKAVVQEIIHVFLMVARSHLVNHMAVSFRWIGTFTFTKAHSRRVTSKRVIDSSGKTSFEMSELGPTCRIRFRPTAKLKEESRWFPPEELEEEKEKEKEREQRLQEYLLTISG